MRKQGSLHLDPHDLLDTCLSSEALGPSLKSQGCITTYTPLDPPPLAKCLSQDEGGASSKPAVLSALNQKLRVT